MLTSTMDLARKLRFLIKRVLFFKGNKIIPVRMAYDEWAKTYDAQLEDGNLTVFYNDWLVDRLLKKVTIKGMTVCDFGVGTGRYYHKISNHDPKKWVGCDISQGMLDQLVEKIPDAEVHKIDDHQLYFLEDRELDILFSSLTIGYIQNLEDALSEWNRVLKPGGTLVLSVFHPGFPQTKTTRTFKNEQGRVRIIESYHRSREELERLFKANNWQILYAEDAVIDERAIPELERMNKSVMYEELVGKPLVVGYILRKQ